MWEHTLIVGCQGVVSSSTGLCLVGPTKVGKSFLCIEGYLKVENKEYLVDFGVMLCFTSVCFNAVLTLFLDQSDDDIQSLS